MAEAGGSFSLFCDVAGNVWGCGRNSQHLGFNSARTFYSPIQLSVSNVEFISAGEYHSLFLDSNGDSWSCGLGIYGQLGISYATLDEYYATKITKIELPKVKAIKACPFHSMFIDIDDYVWSCGENDCNKLGFKGRNTRLPLKVTDLPPIASVCGGSHHSMFLDTNGVVWGCGKNDHHQVIFDFPGLCVQDVTQVPNVPRMKSIAAGFHHTVFLDENGSVWVCGHNKFGQLGIDPDKSKMRQVEDLPPIQSIHAGSYQTCLVDTSGNVWAAGKITKDLFPQATTFTKMQHLPPITAASVQRHALFTDTSGDVWGLGGNQYGELGLGNTVTACTTATQIPSMNVRTRPLTRTKSARS